MVAREASRRRRGDVPLTVTTSHVDMARESTVKTPKSSNRTPISKPGDEVEYDENPTELFELINNGDFDGGAKHALDYPEEASVWIACHDQSRDSKKQGLKWRYLPLHLVCLNPKPSAELVRALLFTYPKAAKLRAHDGNLAIHFLLSVGCQDLSIIEFLLNAYPESVEKRDRTGQTLFQIVASAHKAGKSSDDSMMRVLSFLRRWTIAEDRNPSETVSARRGGLEVADQRSKSRHRERTFLKANSFDIASRPESLPKKKERMLESKLDEALTERDALRDMVDQRSAQKDGAQDDVVKALRKKLSDSVNNMKEQNNRMVALQKQVQELSGQMNDQVATIDQLKAEKHRGQIENQTSELEVANYQTGSQRDTANRSNTEETLREALRSRVAELESLLNEERAKKSRNEIGAISNEARLQARLDSLEREVLKSVGAGETLSGEGVISAASLKLIIVERDRLKEKNASLQNQVEFLKVQCDTLQKGNDDIRGVPTNEVDSFLASADNLKEGRDSLKDMNASLQNHIVILKEKCEMLQRESDEKETIRVQLRSSEKNLKSLSETHDDTLRELDRLRRTSDATEKQMHTKVIELEKQVQEAKILKQRLANMEHELALAKAATELLQQQADTRSKHNEDELQSRQQEMREELNELLSYIHDLSSNTNLRENCYQLQEENSVLRSQIEKLEKNETKSVRVEQETDHIQLYKQQIADYKTKTESLTKTHSELRDLIGKNNSKYLVKIESLTKQVDDLQRRNTSLVKQIKELASENSEMRNGLALMMATDGKGNKKEFMALSDRLKRVAAFLVAVSALQRQIVQASENEQSPRSTDDDGAMMAKISNDKLHIESPRNLLEVLRKKYDVLSTSPDDRDDIVNSATKLEEGVRTAFSENRDISLDLGIQREELESIAKELKQVQ